MGARKTRRKLLLGFVSLIILLGIPSFVAAEDPVDFIDSNLKAAVENALGITDPTPTDMLGLTVLQANYGGIFDLTGLEFATNLSRLELNVNQISDLTPLSGLTNLTVLWLYKNQIEDISAMAGLTNLTWLWLNENQISDISALAGMTKLTSLWLFSNQISDISALAGLTNLETLSLNNNQISNISALSNLTQLTNLNLYNNQFISDITPLSGLTNLHILRLGLNQISDISALAGLTNLTSLEMGGNQINDISAVAGLSNLTVLAFSQNQVSDMSVVAGLTNLTNLDFRWNPTSDISPVSGLTGLIQLWGGMNEISDISTLSELINLQWLWLGGNQISDISALAGMTNLTDLRINHNQISDISALAGMTNLTILGIQNNLITDISTLAGLTNLETLSLNNNQISNISVVSGMTNLKVLRAYVNQISDISSLAGLTKLTELPLYQNQISDISALAGMTNLMLLYLQSNPLNQETYCLYLPLIEENNPAVNLTYDDDPYGSCNNQPVANAGENISIASEEQTLTVIQGAASDPDNDDLNYRWLEGETVLSAWHAVSASGEAYLDLSNILSFSLGEHNLTLEVSDGAATSSDKMILTVDNSAPHPAPAGAGVYEIDAPVTLGGQVSDFDGDLVAYEWFDGEQSLFAGQIQTLEGGTPVTLPSHTISDLNIGIHTLTLSVDDGMNDPVSSEIIIEVTDTTNPTLAPVPDKTILWPPNHKMVDILIEVNASDNSGDPVELSATVSSNEPQEDLGDGDTSPDWTEPVISDGIISLELRAERSGSGDGRVYTITITGTDALGNSSQADVEIIVPHDKGKK